MTGMLLNYRPKDKSTYQILSSKCLLCLVYEMILRCTCPIITPIDLDLIFMVQWSKVKFLSFWSLFQYYMHSFNCILCVGIFYAVHVILAGLIWPLPQNSSNMIKFLFKWCVILFHIMFFWEKTFFMNNHTRV